MQAYSSSGVDNSLSAGNKYGVRAKHCITALKKQVLPKFDRPRTRGNRLTSFARTRLAWPGMFEFPPNECTILIEWPKSERIASLLISVGSASALPSPFVSVVVGAASPFSTGGSIAIGDGLGLEISVLTQSMHCCRFGSIFLTNASHS